MAEAPFERRLVLPLRELEVVEPGEAERRGEQVERELGPVDEGYAHRLDPVALDLVAGIGLVEGVRGGVGRSLPEAVAPHVALEVRVGAGDPPLVRQVPVGGDYGHRRVRQERRDLAPERVERGRP